MANSFSTPFSSSTRNPLSRMSRAGFGRTVLFAHIAAMPTPSAFARWKARLLALAFTSAKSARGQFTVRQGTIFESSHLPLHLWLQVIHLMCASKKGISTNQIQRMLSCSMKTAWFLTHVSARQCATELSRLWAGLVGWSRLTRPISGARTASRLARLRPQECGPYPCRARWKSSVLHVEKASRDVVIPLVRENIDRESHVMTDEAPVYSKLGNDSPSTALLSIRVESTAIATRERREDQYQHR